MIKNCIKCNNTYKTYPSHFERRKYCSFSCKNIGNTNMLGKHWKIKDTSKMKGRKPGNYIEDRSKLAKAKEQRNDTRHHEWSKNVKNRDGWKCKISNGSCSGRLEAHHILSWRSHEELRYEVNNGITLCHFHHPRKRNDEISLSPYFMDLIKSAKN